MTRGSEVRPFLWQVRGEPNRLILHTEIKTGKMFVSSEHRNNETSA